MANIRRYPATLKRVIDGDTVELKVDLGFRVFSDICFRLARINTPELGAPKAQEAKEFVQKWLHAQGLIVETAKGDKYGRWVGDIFHDFTGGNLSNALLVAGLAEPYPKPKAPALSNPENI